MLTFFAKNVRNVCTAKVPHNFSWKNGSVFAHNIYYNFIYLKFNDSLTNDVVSF